MEKAVVQPVLDEVFVVVAAGAMVGEEDGGGFSMGTVRRRQLVVVSREGLVENVSL